MHSLPQILYSDNAKTFMKGGSILESSLQAKEFQHELERLDIRHIRIPLYSAWIGSAWERLIRVLKNCLRPPPTIINIDSSSTDKVLVQPKANISVRPKRKATAKFHQMMKKKN